MRTDTDVERSIEVRRQIHELAHLLRSSCPPSGLERVSRSLHPRARELTPVEMRAIEMTVRPLR